MKKIICLLIVIACLCSPYIVSAQGEESHIIYSTKPVGDELVAVAEAWLNANHPAHTIYYAITYVQSGPTGTYLCLAGLQIENVEQDWNVENNAIWTGTIKILSGGEVVPFSANLSERGGNKLAAQHRAAGGGSYLRFPWEGGKSLVYGRRGVHGSGDYGTTGMLAVDLVGGNALGTNIASNTVYAVDGGDVDYVCEDGTSTAVRTHNDTTGDYFVYAHLIDNDNLAMAHSFNQSDVIGKLVYGSFTDTCGWAVQQPTNYHLHFMFTPTTLFQIEGCVLNIASQEWKCGDRTVKVNDTLYSSGSGVPTGADDPSSGINNSVSAAGMITFFDMFVGGMVFLAQGSLTLMPSAESSFWTFRDNVINTVLILLKIAMVLVKGNLNLGLFMATISFFLIVWIFTFMLRFAARVMKIIAAVTRLL
jgi:hypothetical protein